MARAARLERLDAHRVELETDYRAALIAALRTTASGKFGLFDHDQNKETRKRTAAIVEPILALGEDIDEMRSQLDIEPFALHQEFLASRGRPKSSQEVGEAKQAQAWLKRLESEGL
jgi:hypothetical protein